MNTRYIILASLTLLLTAGCKERIPVKETQPTTIVEPLGVRPKYHWRQGHWSFSRKNGMYVWREGRWINRRKHTRWVEGHWIQTSRGKMYMEGHWE